MASVTAQASPQTEWGLDELMHRLSAVSSAQARFVEERHMSVLTEPLVLEGRLYYRAPDYVRKDLEHPYAESYEINGDVLVIENPEHGRRTLVLEDYPVLQAFSEAFRASLAGDRQGLEDHYRLELTGNVDDWMLELRPSDEESRQYVETITIRGRAAELYRIEIREVGGDLSVMLIREESER